MPAQAGVVIVGLNEFRAAIRAAAVVEPKKLTLALKAAGVPIVRDASARAPRRTGALAGGYNTAVAGSKASVVSRVPYAGGAEWGHFGKWSGFPGSPPRYVWPAIESNTGTIETILYAELLDVVSAFGWFH